MKKALALILVISTALCLTACGSTADNTSSAAASRPVQNTSSETSSASLYQKKLESKMANPDEEESKSESENESKEESKKEESKKEESKKEESKSSESKQDESKAESKETEPESESKDESKSYSLEGDKYTYEGVTMTLPEGFHTQSEGIQTLLVSEEYPYIGDNIYFANMGKVYDDFSEENINKEYPELFDGFQGCDYFKRYDVDGCEVVEFAFKANAGDTVVTQTQVACMLKNKTIAIIITDGSGKYTYDFENAVNSLRIDDED